MVFLVLVLHLLGAAVWVGGHLVLSFTVLPGALRGRDPGPVLRFEKPFERIGIPALIVQVITGLWLADRYVPGILPALDFADRLHTIVAIKLLLLMATAITGAHARFWIIPRLTPQRMPALAVHVMVVSTMAVALLVLGVSVRYL